VTAVPWLARKALHGVTLLLFQSYHSMAFCRITMQLNRLNGR